MESIESFLLFFFDFAFSPILCLFGFEAGLAEVSQCLSDGRGFEVK